jgi:recombination protein RecR
VPRYAEPMARLIDELKKLPGVGTKTAQRFAFHILRSGDDDAFALAEAVRGLKASLRLCSICNNITDVDPCAYCTSASRNQRMVCVVEEPTNIDAVERTRFGGVYHVLHGTLSPLHGVGPEQLRGRSLIERVERGEVDEVILATSPTLEGEATASWLAGALRGLNVRITRIATGVPAGSDIEYADEVTMAHALEGRHEMKP